MKRKQHKEGKQCILVWASPKCGWVQAEDATYAVALQNGSTFVLDKSAALVFLSDTLSGLLITPDEKQQVDVRKAINHSAIFLISS